MSGIGALLGLVAAMGLWLAISYAPPLRRPRLVDRLAPFLADAPSRLLIDQERASPFGAFGRLTRSVLADVAGIIDRVVGGERSVRRRLAAGGFRQSVEDFRIEQVIWGVLGALAGVGLAAGIAIVSGSVNVLAGVLLTGSGLIAGVLGRDWWLTSQVRRREEAILAEFPVVAELLALAVTAGEAPAAALDRVCRLCQGELARELNTALTDVKTGATLPAALLAVAERTSLDVLARFVDGLVIALERGTPLGDVLRAQAADVREAGKRSLLAAGGRRELLMMVPVVFLILPVTVLFALYPGLVTITLLTH